VSNMQSTSQRKYLLVSKDLLLSLKGYSKYSNILLKTITEHFLILGMNIANELYMKDMMNELLHPRIDGLKFLISKNDKSYLVGSPDIHQMVTQCARDWKIKLIEATRNLVLLGMWAYFNTDPRDNPEYDSRMKISQSIIEHWQKKHPDKSLEQEFGSDYRKKMEADVLRDIVFSGKRHTTISKQQPPRPSDEHDDMKLSIRDLFDLSLFFGGSWLLSENERLRTENEELRKIIDNIKSKEKPSPDNSLSTEQHEGTLHSNSDSKQQSDLPRL
jgi:hypothetical protein